MNNMAYDEKDNDAAMAALGMVVRAVSNEKKHFMALREDCPHFKSPSDCSNRHNMIIHCGTDFCPLGGRS
jgi:hypothetical protein